MKTLEIGAWGTMSSRNHSAVTFVETWVRERLDADGTSAHGWPHTDRVRRNIQPLARAEGVDPILAELAALLHDVGRTLPGPESEHGARSAALAEPVLADLALALEAKEAVLHAIRWHNSKRDDTRLLVVLRDADMLDGLGATGIMRAFMSKGHLPPYDPDAPFAEENARWPTTSAGDQVLIQLKFYDWLNTGIAREMAQERFAFMQTFLVQIRNELVHSQQAE